MRFDAKREPEHNSRPRKEEINNETTEHDPQTERRANVREREVSEGKR